MNNLLKDQFYLILLEDGFMINKIASCLQLYAMVSYAKLILLFKHKTNQEVNNDLLNQIDIFSTELNLKNKRQYLTFLINNRIIIDNSFFLTSLFKEYSTLLHKFINESSLEETTEVAKTKVDEFKRLFYPEDEILYFFTNHRRIAYSFKFLDDFYPIFSSTYSIKNQKDNEFIIDMLLNVIDDNKVVLTKTKFYYQKQNLDLELNELKNQSSLDSNFMETSRVLEKNKYHSKQPKIHIRNLPQFDNMRIDNINKKLLIRLKKSIKLNLDYKSSFILTKFTNSEITPPFSTEISNETISFRSVNVSYLNWLFSFQDMRLVMEDYLNKHIESEVNYFGILYKASNKDKERLEIFLNNFLFYYNRD